MFRLACPRTSAKPKLIIFLLGYHLHFINFRCIFHAEIQDGIVGLDLMTGKDDFLHHRLQLCMFAVLFEGKDTHLFSIILQDNNSLT